MAAAVEPIYTFTRPSEDGQMISYQRRVSSIINGVMDDDDIEVIDPYTKKRRSEELRAKRESGLSAANDNPYQMNSSQLSGGHSGQVSHGRSVAASHDGAPSSGGMSRLRRTAIPEEVDARSEAIVSQFSENFVGGPPPPPPPPPPPVSAPVVMRTKARQDGGEDMREAIARMAGMMSDRNADKDPSEIYSAAANRSVSPPPGQSGGGLMDDLKRMLDQRKNGMPIKKPGPVPPPKRMSRMTSPSTVGNEEYYQPSVIQPAVVAAAAATGVYAAPSIGMESRSIIQHSAPSFVESASSFVQPVVVSTAAEVYSPPPASLDSPSLLAHSTSVNHHSPPSVIDAQHSEMNYSPVSNTEAAVIHSAPSVINSQHSVLNSAPIINSAFSESGFQPVVEQAASSVHQPITNHGFHSAEQNAPGNGNEMHDYFSSIGLNVENALSDIHDPSQKPDNIATSHSVNRNFEEPHEINFSSAGIHNRPLHAADSILDDKTNDGLDGVMDFSNHSANFSSAEAVSEAIVPTSTPVLQSAPMITVVSHSPLEQPVVGELTKVRKPKHSAAERESTISGGPPSVYNAEEKAEATNKYTSGFVGIILPETSQVPSILNSAPQKQSSVGVMNNTQPVLYNSNHENQNVTEIAVTKLETNVHSTLVHPVESALGIEKANSTVDQDEIDQIYSAIRGNPVPPQTLPAVNSAPPVVVPQQSPPAALQKPYSSNKTLDKPQVLALRYAQPRRAEEVKQPFAQSASHGLEPDEDEILRMLDTVCDVEEAKNFDFSPAGNLTGAMSSSGLNNNLGAIVKNDSLNRKKISMAAQLQQLAMNNKSSPFEVNSDSDFHLEEAMAINVQTPKKYQHFDTPNFKQNPLPNSRKSIQNIQDFQPIQKPQETSEIPPWSKVPQNRNVNASNNVPAVPIVGQLLDDDDDLNNNWLLMNTGNGANEQPNTNFAPVLNERTNPLQAQFSQEKHRDRTEYIESQPIQYEGQYQPHSLQPQVMTHVEQDHRSHEQHVRQPEMVTYRKQEENGPPKFMRMLKSLISGDYGKQRVENDVQFRKPQQVQWLDDQDIIAGEKYVHERGNAEFLHSNQAGLLQAKQAGPISANYSGQMQATYPELMAPQSALQLPAEYPERIRTEYVEHSGHMQVPAQNVQFPGMRQRTLSESNIHDAGRVRNGQVRRSPWNVLQSFFVSNKTHREDFTDRENRQYPPQFAQSLPPNYSNIAAFRYSSTSSPFQQNRMGIPMGVGGYTGRHTVGGGCIHTLRNLGQPNPPQMGHHQQFYTPDRHQDFRNLPNFVLEPAAAKTPEVLRVHADYHPGSSREGVTHIAAPLIGDQGITSSHLHIQTPLVNQNSPYPSAVPGASPNLHPNIGLAQNYPPANRLLLQSQL